MEQQVTDQVVCPTCGNAMQPVVRRSDFVLMLCSDCRISVSVAPPTCSSYDFPVACPQCTSLSGTPYRVSTRPNGGVLVAVKCDACGHDWHCTLPPADAKPSFPAARSGK